MPGYDKAKLIPEILQRIAGGESLRSVCRDEGMPDPATFLRWTSDNEGCAQQYARAREDQADAIFEEMFEIADDGSNDWMERQNADGTTGDEILNSEHVQRSKLRIDTRKWALARMSPKKYGDVQKIELDGQVNVRHATVSFTRPED